MLNDFLAVGFFTLSDRRSVKKQKMEKIFRTTVIENHLDCFPQRSSICKNSTQIRLRCQRTI